MIVDRYHLSLLKMRPNMSLTVTMETEPSEHVLSNHNDPVADPAKVSQSRSQSPRVFWSVSWCWAKDTWSLGRRLRESERMCVENAFVSFLRPAYNDEIQNQCVSLEYFLRKANDGKKKLKKNLWKNSNGKSWQNNDFSRRCKLKSEFWECVYDSKFEHRRPCRILWLFMLVVLLETFYRTIQRNTGKLKSFA